jgi:hypothetical protein
MFCGGRGKGRKPVGFCFARGLCAVELGAIQFGVTNDPTRKIFINYGGNAQAVPYTYTETRTYPSSSKILEFDFGGRKERLQWTADS